MRFEVYCATACGRKGGTQYQRGMVETSDNQTIRHQTGSAPWNIYSTYDRNFVWGDFSTPLRFARNDGSGMEPLRAASAGNFLH